MQYVSICTMYSFFTTLSFSSKCLAKYYCTCFTPEVQAALAVQMAAEQERKMWLWACFFSGGNGVSKPCGKNRSMFQLQVNISKEYVLDSRSTFSRQRTLWMVLEVAKSLVLWWIWGYIREINTNDVFKKSKSMKCMSWLSANHFNKGFQWVLSGMKPTSVAPEFLESFLRSCRQTPSWVCYCKLWTPAARRKGVSQGHFCDKQLLYFVASLGEP